MSELRNIFITDPTTGDQASVNSDGQLHVVEEGSVDSNNSTTTPLGGAAVFTGTSTNILAYGGITILVGSDVAGTLTTQYSPDGSDWHAGESYDILAGANKFFTPPAQSAYFRVVYTNGGAAQSTFYIHTVLKKQSIKWSSHNIDDPIVDQDDAELVKAVITGKKTSGAYDNVSLTNGANMKVSLEELESSISSNSNSQLNITQFDSSGNEVAVEALSDDDHDIDGSIGQVTAAGLYARIDADTVKPLRMDASTHSIQTIAYAHHEIHSGSHFFTGDYVDLSNGQVYDILWTTPNTTKYGHMVFQLATEAEATFQYYEDTVASANGTALNMYDRNRTTDNTPGITFYHTPTVTTVGTLIGQGIFGSGRSQGGELRDSNEFVLKPNTKYMMRVTNNTTTANWYDWFFDWYEHEDKD